jgi:hypothetical protein
VDLFNNLSNVAFSWWWYGEEGRTKTADAADTWLMPVLLAGCVGVVLTGLVLLVTR